MAWKLEKRVAHPFEEKTEKNNEVLTLPTTPLPKRFGNTYPLNKIQEKIMKQQKHYHHLLLSQPLLIHHKVNLLYLKQNQRWMQELKKKDLKTRPGFKNSEAKTLKKWMQWKNKNYHRINISCLLNNIICKKIIFEEKKHFLF